MPQQLFYPPLPTWIAAVLLGTALILLIAFAVALRHMVANIKEDTNAKGIHQSDDRQ